MSAMTPPHPPTPSKSTQLPPLGPLGSTAKPAHTAFRSFMSGAALSAACFYLYLVLAQPPAQVTRHGEQVGCFDGTLVTEPVEGCIPMFLDVERVVCTGDTLVSTELATMVGLTSISWVDWLYISMRGQREVDVSEGIVILKDEGCDAEAGISLHCEGLFEWKGHLNELPLLNLTSCADLNMVKRLFLGEYEQEEWLHYCDTRKDRELRPSDRVVYSNSGKHTHRRANGHSRSSLCEVFQGEDGTYLCLPYADGMIKLGDIEVEPGPRVKYLGSGYVEDDTFPECMADLPRTIDCDRKMWKKLHSAILDDYPSCEDQVILDAVQSGTESEVEELWLATCSNVTSIRNRNLGSTQGGCHHTSYTADRCSGSNDIIWAYSQMSWYRAGRGEWVGHVHFHGVVDVRSSRFSSDNCGNYADATNEYISHWARPVISRYDSYINQAENGFHSWAMGWCECQHAGASAELQIIDLRASDSAYITAPSGTNYYSSGCTGHSDDTYLCKRSTNSCPLAVVGTSDSYLVGSGTIGGCNFGAGIGHTSSNINTVAEPSKVIRPICDCDETTYTHDEQC